MYAERASVLHRELTLRMNIQVTLSGFNQKNMTNDG